MKQCMYGTKICNIYDLQKCLTQTWVDFEQNVVDAAIDQCMLVVDTLRTCFEIIVYFVLCGSSEHFMKLSM